MSPEIPGKAVLVADGGGMPTRGRARLEDSPVGMAESFELSRARESAWPSSDDRDPPPREGMPVPAHRVTIAVRRGLSFGALGRSRDLAGTSTRPEVRSSARQNGERRRELSVVAPAYNEERRLPALLERIAAPDSWAPASLSFRELIVVDDGSEDDTVALLNRATGLEGRLRVVELSRHRGKGAAV